MATKSQDVQLNIRAVDYSSKTTDQVVNSLKELNKAQAAQIEGAKKGAVVADDLEKSFNSLADVVKELSSQSGLVKMLDTQNEKLTAAKTRLDKATEAQQKYLDKLKEGEEITPKQTARIESLGKAVAGAQGKFEGAQAAVAATVKRLSDLGIAADQGAAAQDKIATAIGETMVVLSEIKNAYQGLAAAVAQRNAALADEAQRERQVGVDIAFANAQRQAEIEADSRLLAAQKAVEAERERELNVDRQFTQAQNDVVASIQREEQARRAQTAAIQAAAAAANAAKSSSAGIARPGAAAPVSNVAGQIRDIAEPAAAAARNVDTLEQSIAGLESTVRTINGPIENYRELLNQARTAQAGLQQIAGNVDAYNRQITALRAARAEYVAQRTALNQLVAALQAGTGGDNILTQIQRQQGALRGAAQGLAAVTTSARAAREALSTAGVNTSNMAAAEAELTAQATRAAGAVSGLNTALNEHGEATNRSTAAMGGWFGGGRTTLSYAQRIRGELLGLATAFIGVNAAIEEGKMALDTYSTRQSLLGQLTVAFKGDIAAAQQEFDYLRQQADRLGFSFDKIGPAFAKFSIAAKTAGLTGQEVRFTFEQLALAAQKGGLSTDKFESVMIAFEQMLSKGKISREELVKQLGNALPGAFEIAAVKIAGTTKAFNDMLDAGMSSLQVIEFARAIGDTYGKATGVVNGLSKAQIELSNAVGDFQDTVAKSGFAAEFTKFLKDLTVFMKSNDGKQFAETLGQAFGVLIKALELAAKGITIIRDTIIAVVAIKFIDWVFKAGGALETLKNVYTLLNAQMVIFRDLAVADAFLVIGGGAATATTEIGLLTKGMAWLRLGILAVIDALPLLLTAYAAFEAGKALVSDKSDDSMRELMSTNVALLWDAEQKALEKYNKAKTAYEAARGTAEEGALKYRYDKLKDMAVQAVADRTNAEKAEYEKQEAAKGKATAAPAKRNTMAEDLEAEAEDAKKLIEKSQADLLEARKAGAKKDLKARLEFIDQSFQVERDAAKTRYKDAATLEVVLQRIQQASHIAQQAETQRFNNEQATSGETAAKRSLRLANEIATELKEGQDKVDKAAGAADPTKSFADRTIANQKVMFNSFDKTQAKIDQLRASGAKNAAEDANSAQSQLNLIRSQAVATQERVDASAEVLRIDKQITDTMMIQKAQIDAIKAEGAAGKLSPEEVLSQTNAAVAATAPKIAALGQKAMEFAASVKNLLTPTELATALSKGTLALAQNNSTAVQAANSLAAAQVALNVILDQRQALITDIQTKEALGIKSNAASADEQDAVYDSFKDKILKATAAVKELVEQTRKLGGVAPAELDKIAASVDNLTLKTKNQAKTTKDLGNAMANSLVNQATTAVDSLGAALGRVVLKQESIGQGFRDAAVAAEMFFAGVLKDVAAAIAKQLILNMLLSVVGEKSSTGASLIKLGAQAAATMHTGGTVGGVQNMSTSVSPAVFMGAPRFHDGGFPGLRSDEVPTILQKGEQVLSRNDPNNVLNKSGAAGGSGGDSSTKFVLVDDRSNVPSAMQSAAGEKVTMVHLKNNIPTLRQWLKK